MFCVLLNFGFIVCVVVFSCHSPSEQKGTRGGIGRQRFAAAFRGRK